MGQSMRAPAESDGSNSLDSLRPTPAKAELRVNADQSSLRALIGESIRAVSSQKAAATDMQIDPAQLTRQLQTGHLTVERLEALGPPVLAKLGEVLVQQYGPLTDPKASARRDCDAMDDLVKRLRQFVEHT